MKIRPVILCGGAGTRLWPNSKNHQAKQFIDFGGWTLFEKTLIRRGATIGANATIVCGITLGRYCFIGAGAVVVRDVPDYGLVLGNPGKHQGFMSRHGHRLNFSEEGRASCPESGFNYVRAGEEVRCEDLAEEASLPDHLSVGTENYDFFKKAEK